LESDGIGHDAEESDEGENETDGGTGAEGDEAEFGFLENVFLQFVFEGRGTLEDDVGIDVGEELADWVGETQGIGDRANEERTVENTGEGVRNVSLGQLLATWLELEVPEVSDNADDFEIGIVGSIGTLVEFIEFDLTTERIFAGEIGFDERLADDGNAASAGDVVGGEQATAKKLQADGGEVGGANGVEGSSPRLVVRLAGNGDIVGARTAEGRNAEGDGGLSDARENGNACESLFEEGVFTFHGFIGVGGKVNLREEQAGGAHAGVEIVESEEAADHESSKDEKENGERDLGDDEAGTNANAAVSDVGVDSAGLETGAKIFFDGEERRRKSEEESSDERKSDGKKEHGKIQS
jgi:hypothetical protein